MVDGLDAHHRSGVPGSLLRLPSQRREEREAIEAQLKPVMASVKRLALPLPGRPYALMIPKTNAVWYRDRRARAGIILASPVLFQRASRPENR